MSTMSITVSGTPVSVKNQAFRLDDAADKRSTLTFTVIDSAGTASFVRGQPVVVTDSVLGVLYSGYVSKSQPTKYSPDPNNPALDHAITCMDKHYLADKRVNVTNYINWNGGDIICDFINQKLAAEGVTGAFAQRADYTQASFAQGTLSGVAATSNAVPLLTAPQSNVMPSTANTGDLELVTAGSAVTITEKTTSDFSSGTLTNMAATSSGLSPTTQSAICIQAQLPLSPGPASDSAYVQIWSGSMVVGTNDTLNYDIWIASTSPTYVAAVDLTFSDGTLLSGVTSGCFDQNGLFPGPTTPYITGPPIVQAGAIDLSTYAKDRWYTRQVALTPLVGKTITSVSVALAGASTGAYVVYVKNCYLGSQAGAPFFATNATATQVNPPVVTSAAGYMPSLIVTSIVNAWNPVASSRVSPAYSIDATKLIRSSLVTWTASLPITTPTGQAALSGQPGAAPAPLFVLLVSYDGATWLACTNNQPLPGLPAGSNVAGLSLYLKEIFSSGPYPTALPALTQVTITLTSAAYAVTSDITASYGTAAQWNSGTESATAPNAAGNLVLGTLSHNWGNGQITNQTFFPTGGNVTQSVSSGSYKISTPAIADTNGVSRLDFVGTVADFTLDCDVTCGGAEVSIFYRTTNWTFAQFNSAYFVGFYNPSTLHFGYGSNSTSHTDGTQTVLASSSPTVTVGTVYHLKIVVQGNRHRIYWNNASSPTFDIIDGTFPQPGGLGVAVYSGGGAGAAYGLWNNLVVTPVLSGSWQSSSLSLNSLGICGASSVNWAEMLPSGALSTTSIVLTSLDAGATWQQCQNGSAIPNLPKGSSVAGTSLLIMVVLFASSAQLTPAILGLYVRVCGNYGTVTGTRISPVLSLTPAGRIASSVVAWNANTPNGTSCSVAVAQNSATFYAERALEAPVVYAGSGTDVTASNGGPVPGYYHQPPPIIDTMGLDSHISYTSTAKGGTAQDTFTRLNQSGWGTGSDGQAWSTVLGSPTLAIASNEGTMTGTTAECHMTYGAKSGTDQEGLVRFSVTSTSDLIAIMLRSPDASNWYRCDVSFGNIHMAKLVAGVFTSISSFVGISITANAFWWLRFRIVGTQLQGRAWADGTTEPTTWQVSVTDSSLTTGGWGLQTVLNAATDTASFDHFQIDLATATYDTTNKRLTLSNGVGAVYLYSAAWALSALSAPIQYQGNPIQYGVPSRADVDLFVDMDRSDAGGMVWRYVDSNNYYELGCYDDSSSGGFTNQLRLYKVASGVRSLLGSASTISWPRSTAGQTPYKRIRVTMIGSVITVYFDGVVMQTYTDGSPLGAGLCGLRNDGGTSRYYQLRIQLLGDTMSGVNLYTKVTLSTSDPAQMPQLFVLVASVRGPGIASGLAVPQLHNPNLPFAQYIAKEMDSLVQASGDYYWLIDNNGVTWFQQRLASPAPWLLASSDPNVLYTPTVTPTSAADLYRNGQYVTGVLKLITVTNEPHVADGTATSWQMTYPLFSAPTITSNGIAKSVGVQGVDAGKDLYWSPGSQSITQDTTAAKTPAGTLMLYSYVGQQPSQVNVNNATEQTARAAVETGTSGIIEEIEMAPTSFLSNMTVPTGTTWANGLLARYGTNNTIEVVATTRRYGLLPGQITGVFLPEFGYLNLQLPIVRVVTQAEQQADGNVYYTYQVTLSNGPNLSSWASVWF